MIIPLYSNCGILARYANRHGLITGATGTGKTVTLQTLCEGFSRAGVPVFVADIKGDIAGLATANPVAFYDVAGAKGAPFKISLESLGSSLLARLFGLTDAQHGVLDYNMDFRPADLKALQRLVAHHGGSTTSAALMRNLRRFEREGGAELIGQNCFDVSRLFEYRENAGLISILDAQKLSQNPLAYSTLLIWLLGELFERMPEAGDLDRPRLVVFLDESHLIFQDCNPYLMQRLERTVRLIRSKGVGLYFVSQLPSDIPPNIAGQIGNRIQHALRGATVEDSRAIKAAADAMPINPALNTAQEIRQLGTGRALVSFIGDNGNPTPCRKIAIDPPQCRLGAISDEERNKHIPEYKGTVLESRRVYTKAIPVHFAAFLFALYWFFS